MDFPILSTVIWLPVVGGLLMLALGQGRAELVRWTALAASTMTFLVSLGLITGSVWLHGVDGRVWSGSGHASWMLVAWGIYAGLAAARFVGRQGSHQAAASAVAGFAFLLFAVVGVEILS